MYLESMETFQKYIQKPMKYIDEMANKSAMANSPKDIEDSQQEASNFGTGS